MEDVYVLGVGQMPVSEKTDLSVKQMGAMAIRAALKDANLNRVDAIYVGNMLSGLLSNQQVLAPIIAHVAGLTGVEALTVEAACASGAAAARFAAMAIRSGAHDVVAACGVEHMTGSDKAATTRALATASDWDTEGRCGETILSLNAMLMSLYMERYGLGIGCFVPFVLNAHNNSRTNPNSLFRNNVTEEDYHSSPVIKEPLRRLDAAPICDGAAAVVLGTKSALTRTAKGNPAVVIRASAVGTDVARLTARKDPLRLEGAIASCRRAYSQAKLSPADIDLFEAHDAFSIMMVLSLEAAGFASPGHGSKLGKTGAIRLDGNIPISTMGGLKARGHPVGASGIYQIVDAYVQLTGQAFDNQIDGARIAMTQSFGGLATTAITHILERVET